MNTLFCSDHSRQIGENLIGSATNYETYILIECPPPWVSPAFNSKWVPDNLRVLVEEIQQSKLSIRLLLIANDESHRSEQTTLLIYHQQQGLTHGYHKQEFCLPNIEQAAGVIRKWLSGKNCDEQIETSQIRDILVCTHGSHDKCCARYGNPFYFHSQQTINNLQLDNVRLWRSSHFGGHRFAPTAIEFPSGRYYGMLDQDSFSAILTRSGDIQCLNQVYRGWGILPSALQVLEKELILHHGWDWFNYQIAGKILEQSLDNNTFLGELSFEKPDSSFYTYQAKIIKDTDKTQAVITSCNHPQDTCLIKKYTVSELGLIAKKVASYSV